MGQRERTTIRASRLYAAEWDMGLSRSGPISVKDDVKPAPYSSIARKLKGCRSPVGPESLDIASALLFGLAEQEDELVGLAANGWVEDILVAWVGGLGEQLAFADKL